MHILSLAALASALASQAYAIPVEVPHWTDTPESINFFARDPSANTTTLAERGALEKRAWFYPSDQCSACVSICLGAAGLGGYVYSTWSRLPRDMVTSFATCGIRCVDRGDCLPEQGFTWDWTVNQNVQRRSEPTQMLISLRENGGIENA